MTDPKYSGSPEGARYLFSCTSSPDEWDALSRMDDSRTVRFYGTHPWYFGRHDGERLKDILEADPKACVGEIGLDSRRGSVTEQHDAFMEQLALCKRYERPANVHMIGCESDMLKAVRSSGAVCILHSFTGPESYIHPFAECGCYFSVSPRMMRKDRRKIRLILSAIPEDRLLLETDAPNSDTNILAHISAVADVLEMDPEELARITIRNCASLIPS